MGIAGEFQGDATSRRVVEEKQPDFRIIALDEPSERLRLCYSLLRQFPDLKILALARERNSCVFFWASLDIHSNRVEASEEGILEALRGKAQVPRRYR